MGDTYRAGKEQASASIQEQSGSSRRQLDAKASKVACHRRKRKGYLLWQGLLRGLLCEEVLGEQAKDIMKIQVTTVLSDLEGIPLRDAAIRDTDGKILRPERDFTLRKACTEALQALNLNGDSPDGEERFKRYQLALKVMSSEEPDLTADEIVK